MSVRQLHATTVAPGLWGNLFPRRRRSPQLPHADSTRCVMYMPETKMSVYQPSDICNIVPLLKRWLKMMDPARLLPYWPRLVGWRVGKENNNSFSRSGRTKRLGYLNELYGGMDYRFFTRVEERFWPLHPSIRTHIVTEVRSRSENIQKNKLKVAAEVSISYFMSVSVSLLSICFRDDGSSQKCTVLWRTTRPNT